MAQPPEIAIVGRPNVGKSTLFNRIVGRRKAIVGSLSGLTRDRHRGEAEWRGRRFTVVDTGGLEWESEDEILEQIQQRALEAVDAATLVLFVVDGATGPAAIEAELAAELRRRGVPTILVVNKCDDDPSAPVRAAEFHDLGIHPVFAVSAEHGRGVADLLDEVVSRLPDEETEPDPEPAIRVAVVGRPNVGKSSLVNALLGDERLVVSERAGTTRDAIDTILEADGQRYLLIDTAGIRRTTRREGHAESVSVLIARRRMAEADVALLVIDASVGLSRQDVAIAAEAGEAGCGLIVVVNKSDLIDSGGVRPETVWLDELQRRMGRIGFAVIAFTSALQGTGILGLLPLIEAVQARRQQRVPTSDLNRMFEEIQRLGPHPPPGSPQIKYITQVSVAPPTFVLFVGRGRGRMPESYTRYIENRLRSVFDFAGTPIVVRIRHGNRRKR
jgi:GTP-binding protein